MRISEEVFVERREWERRDRRAGRMEEIEEGREEVMIGDEGVIIGVGESTIGEGREIAEER